MTEKSTFKPGASMSFAEFDPENFERGAKYIFYLDFHEGDRKVTQPVLLARGKRPGKRLVVTAGVHGDEYEGVRTIFDVFHGLDPAAMTGDFLSVPVSNMPAFWNGSRTSPLDGGNLARVFPGSLEAGATAAIAYLMGPAIIARADLYLDLHSGGIRWLYPTMIGYDAQDPHSREAAQAFGTKVLWGHSSDAGGRTVSFAKQQGIPWLYTEAHGAGRIDPTDLAVFVRGVYNLMYHLNILSGTIQTDPVEWHLTGGGDLDAALSSTKRGFVVTDASLFQKVRAGDLLGRLCDPLGQTIEEYRAQVDGVVAIVRGFPVTEAGESLFVVADVLPTPS